jgi:hypothetical protein
MTAMSDYVENALVNWLRGTTFPVVPANVYVALYTTATDDAGGGTEVSTGGGTLYARVAVPTAAGSWDATVGGDGHTQNTGAITFPTAGASWGTISHVGIRDLSAGGNLLYHGALTTPKAVGAGDTFSFAAGALDITFA